MAIAFSIHLNESLTSKLATITGEIVTDSWFVWKFVHNRNQNTPSLFRSFQFVQGKGVVNETPGILRPCNGNTTPHFCGHFPFFGS